MIPEPESLVPHDGSIGGKTMVLHAMFVPMIQTDNENEIFSNLLESWEISDDARTVTLALRSDIEWSDGTPMSSADILMSLTQYLDPSLGEFAARVGGVVGQSAFADGEADSISGLSAPDNLTVVIELEEPDAAWLANFAALGPEIPPLPAHILRDVPHDELLDHEYFQNYPVTSGPFKFVEWVRGQHVEVERNENWSLGEAGFERAFFKVLEDSNVRSAQLETREIQYTNRIEASDVDRISSIDGIEIQSTTGAAPDVWGLMHHDDVLEDRRVRQAMAYAIDREGICQSVLGGHCTVPITNIRQLDPDWAIPTTDVIEYRHDPDRARELLDEAGWDPNTELTFLHRPGTSYVDTAIAIAQDNLADVGVNWTIENVDTGALLERAEDPDFNGWWVTGADFTVDPVAVQPYTSCDTHFPQGPNLIRYCNPELNQLWAAGRQVADQSQRAEIYHEAFRLLNREVPEIYLYAVDSIVAFDSRLKGVKVHSNVNNQYWNIGEWRWEE